MHSCIYVVVLVLLSFTLVFAQPPALSLPCSCQNTTGQFDSVRFLIASVSSQFADLTSALSSGFSSVLANLLSLSVKIETVQQSIPADPSSALSAIQMNDQKLLARMQQLETALAFATKYLETSEYRCNDTYKKLGAAYYRHLDHGDGFRKAHDKYASVGLRRRAKNIILGVADGQDITTVVASRIYEGELKNLSRPTDNRLYIDTFAEHTNFANTYSTDWTVPESSATMNAIIGGARTLAGGLGLHEMIL